MTDTKDDVSVKDHGEALSELMEVIASLLGPGGCPWDQKQTPQTMTDYVIEEAFELVEAIRADAPEFGTEATRSEVKEELGDVAFLLLFLATLYEREGSFNLSESLRYSAAKMIRRHPHVFGDLKLKNQEELLSNWEKIKRNENTEDDEAPKRVYGSLPKGLPPMLKAYRINSKAARAGFTWETDDDQAGQLTSEWKEWEEAKASGDQARMEEEFGDYLFTLIEYGRRHGIKANSSLDGANNKFLSRFNQMEDVVRDKGKDIPDLSLDELNKIWDAVKKK
ncbi:nucleoside triphosphate pyrophosphohydrolase [Desulfovibrio ferrophilus]|uniref:MazG family protein n=1 Tax=Desulfovibrio ferrophilus TaxID=241368 RepID=A0A2Z6B2H6_9BACT|nr:nucleoside triphosphate pyrophosphohydrolase [Desulfovibrio ferrophilus]BBD09719.1 MazG family protein [Desulfovibrio ferrophilus]